MLVANPEKTKSQCKSIKSLQCSGKNLCYESIRRLYQAHVLQTRVILPRTVCNTLVSIHNANHRQTSLCRFKTVICTYSRETLIRRNAYCIEVYFRC